MGESLEEGEVFEILASLADKSLVVTEEHDGATRYHLLETVRQYATDRLAEVGEAGIYRDRHLANFLALAEEAEPYLLGKNVQTWQSRLETEHDNLRSALAWAMGDGTELENALRICGALLYFWLGRGYLAEGRDWCRKVMERADPELKSVARAAALHCSGRLAYDQGDFDTARPLFEESLSISRVLEDLEGITQALNGLGIMTCDQGDYDSARSLHERSLAIRRELNDPWSISQSLNNLGVVEAAQENYSSARSLLEESLSIRRREMGVHRGTAIVLHSLGQVAFEEGDYAIARAYMEESLSMRREVADLPRIAGSLMNLGNVAYELGDFMSARSSYEESLSICQAIHIQEYLASLLDSFAELAMADGTLLLAARLWGAAESLRDAFGGSMWVGVQRRRDTRVAAARAALGDDSAFNAALAEGRALSVEDAIALAREPT